MCSYDIVLTRVSTLTLSSTPAVNINTCAWFPQRLKVTRSRRDADYGIQDRIHGLFRVRHFMCMHHRHNEEAWKGDPGGGLRHNEGGWKGEGSEA